MKRFKSYLEEQLQFTVLTHSDLTKYLKKGNSARLDTFLDKIKNKKEFLTTKGEVIIKDKVPDREEFSKPGFKFKFNTTKGNIQYPGEFLKTPEFGGKGKGFGTAAEDRYLASFRTELERVMDEQEDGALDMLVGGRKVVVSGVGQPKGTPKADFFLLDDMGEEVAWLSHKAGSKSNDFQQYGGLTPRGTKGVFERSKQVNSFIDKLKELYPEGMKSGDSVKRDIDLNGDGKDKLDFTYIQDLIEGISLCCENSKAINETFNLTYGESRSIQDLLKILQSEFDGLKITFKEREKFMPERGTLNISKAKSLLKYSPKFPIVSGFLNYINWYKNFWKKINI